MLVLSCSGSFITYRAADAVQHFHLYWRGDHFAFGHGTYDTVEELAEHFENKPLLGGESGRMIINLRIKLYFSDTHGSMNSMVFNRSHAKSVMAKLYHFDVA